MSVPGYVYAVRCGEFVKIGWSVNPKFRAVKINSDNPMPCQLLGFYEASREDERDVHQHLKAHWAHAEWFRFEGAVVDFVGRLPTAAPDNAPRYRSGRKMYRRDRQKSYMAALAGKPGQVSEWARQLGVTRSWLYHWKRVPAEWVPRVAKVTGIPAHQLRPDIFEPN